MPIRLLNKLSLRIKTIILVILMIVTMALVLTFVYIGHQKGVLQSQLEVLGSALAKNLAFNAELGVLTKNLSVLDELSEGVLQRKDVNYVAIFSNDEELLVYNEKSKEGSSYKSEVLKRQIAESGPAINYYKHMNEEICQVSIPVELLKSEKWIEGGLIAIPETGTETIGEVVVGLSLNSLYKNLAQIKWLTFKFTYLVIFVASIITFFLVNLLTKPIKRLMDATREVARGNLDIQLRSISSDEVGALTASFNTMVKEVKDSRDKIEHNAKELARINSEMEELLHIVSHDLRSPLINIQGFTQRLEPLFQSVVNNINEVVKENIDGKIKDKLTAVKTEVEEKFPVSLRFITKGVDKMDSLLSNLLAVSRVGRKADPVQVNDLNNVLGDVLAIFNHQLKAKGIDIIRRELPAVPCRRNEINQVFSNLISNAINYMKQEPPKIIEIGYTENPQDYQFFVRDTGIGISEEDYEKVFKMFTRVGEIDASGEGIGLAYVQKIIRSHKGKIWVESKKGSGSTFYFTLPKEQKGVS
ncbi:MAG: hypothetical protein DRP74_05255 [Candidatus Omnitrophota bacterium]|nr:MAG: hypothetical protein DRP74_05255 [Candidatus Omnitrophota bacterium]